MAGAGQGAQVGSSGGGDGGLVHGDHGPVRMTAGGDGINLIHSQGLQGPDILENAFG